jgi:uncharacterized protein YqkB
MLVLSEQRHFIRCLSPAESKDGGKSLQNTTKNAEGLGCAAQGASTFWIVGHLEVE